MITFGVVLLIIGFLLSVPFLWSLGMIFVVVGLVFWILGTMGHAIGGRKHYY